MTMAVGSNPAPVYAIQTKRVDHVERFYENKTNGMTVPGSGPTISKFLRLAAVPSTKILFETGCCALSI
jgi:hypothetical protein